MRTIKTVALMTGMLTLFSVAAWAQPKGDSGDSGLGIIVGEPTGISFKTFIGRRHGFDLALAWSTREDNFHIHGDYLFHNWGAFNPNRGRMPLYYGIGGRIRLDDDDATVGLRIPVGFEYLFQGAPLGLFLELAPILDLSPDTDFDVNAGAGVRFYF